MVHSEEHNAFVLESSCFVDTPVLPNRPNIDSYSGEGEPPPPQAKSLASITPRKTTIKARHPVVIHLPTFP